MHRRQTRPRALRKNAVMTVWISLLRGVNVGGINIKSAELRGVFVGMGFDDVVTVLASGNVAFRSPGTDRAALKAGIEAALRERFGYAAWIVLCTKAEVDAAAGAFPFDPADSTRQPYVIFGSDEAALDELVEAAASMDPVVDPVERGSGVVYWSPAAGSSTDTPFAKLLAKAKYKSTTTNRNLRTLQKVLSAASD